MTRVIGVRFKRAGKMYYFNPKDLEVGRGDHVVVETARGIEMGEVVVAPREVEDDHVVAPLKDVVRVATKSDLKNAADNEERERQASAVCQKKIAQHRLDMKLVDVEYTFDNSKIIFYFTAEGRVDFRELVKDLAMQFKMRIELRQIGVRDEAKMLGGLGKCGQPICCGTFLGEFHPVSIKMAKEQNLSLNPTKISGLCGRLMCCLKYEQAYYEGMRKKMPKINKEIMTPDGVGVVIENNALKESSRVRIALPGDTFDIREYDLSDLSSVAAKKPPAPENLPPMEEESELIED
ncbi:MAG: PSP1 domain-containing protein [Christensenellales bacterium]|jgi:cell fate regulator YaaT (PSP1 superfamily)